MKCATRHLDLYHAQIRLLDKTWQPIAGTEDAATRSNRVLKQLLRDYEQPALDPAIDEQLSAYVARRKSGADAD